MLSFLYPWLFAVWLAPILVRLLAPPHQEPRVGLKAPFVKRLEEIAHTKADTGVSISKGSLTQRVLLWVAWSLIIVALARPQWVGEPMSKTVPSRDLLLAVDLSGSMDTADFTNKEGKLVNRLTAVKEVLDEFLTRRDGDRVGLIFFGNAAFVQTPFTEDIEVCRQLLDEAQVGMAGPKTMLGDAIGLAITVFQKSDLSDRVLILLTDGNDSGSKVPPSNAATLASDEGVTIHAIAVGDPEAAGEEAIDEATLVAMAKTTGGGFYRATDREQLETIYSRIDEVETRELEVVTHRPRSDLFYWPLSAAIGLTLAFHLGALLAAKMKRTKRTSNIEHSTSNIEQHGG